jgi:hypothetical protein
MPGPGEPLWTDQDRAWALALAQVEAEVCPDCRRPWAEASDPDNEYAYVGEIARCHACAAGHRAISQHEKDGGDTKALHVTVRKQGELSGRG